MLLRTLMPADNIADNLENYQGDVVRITNLCDCCGFHINKREYAFSIIIGVRFKVRFNFFASFKSSINLSPDRI